MKRLTVLFIFISLCYNAVAQNEKSPLLPTDSCFLAKVLTGNIYFLDKQVTIKDLPWNPHSKFEGVYLKNLILAEDTNNQLNCHIVKVEPGCMLDTHLHEGQIEIHEVIAGEGICYLEGKEINYFTGKISVIPANTIHKVVAGKDGLYLFAKFTPASK